jgi:sugar phosphate permease
MADAAPTVTRKSRVRWFILLLISVMYMITYLDRANISVTAPAMAAEFALSKTETGLIFSAFAWAYALGQIPGGFLADRLGPKRVLLLIVPFWSVMTAATAWASSALTLFGARFVFGLGEAGAFPSATRAMQLWFPKQERGVVQGVTHGFSRLAVAVTPPIAIAIMTALGWRWLFYVFAGMGVGWSVWFAAAYRNRPEEHPRVNAGELAHIREGAVASPMRAAAVPWKAILCAPNMWAIAAAYFCFFYGAYFYLTWFPTYLIEYRHLSLKDVGVLASVPLIAAMIGDLAGGRPSAQDREAGVVATHRGCARAVGGRGVFRPRSRMRWGPPSSVLRFRISAWKWCSDQPGRSPWMSPAYGAEPSRPS